MWYDPVRLLPFQVSRRCVNRQRYRYGFFTGFTRPLSERYYYHRRARRFCWWHGRCHLSFLRIYRTYASTMNHPFGIWFAASRVWCGACVMWVLCHCGWKRLKASHTIYEVRTITPTSRTHSVYTSISPKKSLQFSGFSLRFGGGVGIGVCAPLPTIADSPLYLLMGFHRKQTIIKA